MVIWNRMYNNLLDHRYDFLDVESNLYTILDLTAQILRETIFALRR
jgi:hypothetical protein